MRAEETVLIDEPLETQPPASLGLQFEEAVAWFRRRVPMSEKDWEALEERARRKGFKVAGALQLDVVTQVWQAIDKAVAEGTTFESFKKDVGRQLQEAWGRKDSPRLETIFRTNVQLAYGAGRWAQMTKPAVQKSRPFWRYNALLDSRTTPICRALHGTVREADNEFWRTRLPPVHFNCRSSIETLTRKQAAEEGITSTLPRIGAAKGFGAEPGTDEWEKDLSKIPVPLAEEFRRKAAQGGGGGGGSDGPPGGRPPGGGGGEPPERPPRSVFEPPGGPPPPWFTDTEKRPPGTFDERNQKLLPQEKAITKLLAEEGNHVKSRKQDDRPSADVFVGPTKEAVDSAAARDDARLKVELKTTQRMANATTIRNVLHRATKQARNVILDVRGTGLSRHDVIEGKRLAMPRVRGRLDFVRFIGDDFDLTFWDFE